MLHMNKWFWFNIECGEGLGRDVCVLSELASVEQGKRTPATVSFGELSSDTDSSLELQLLVYGTMELHLHVIECYFGLLGWDCFFETTSTTI